MASHSSHVVNMATSFPGRHGNENGRTVQLRLSRSLTYNRSSSCILSELRNNCKDHRDKILHLSGSLNEQKSLLAARDMRCQQLLSEKNELEERTAGLQQRIRLLKRNAEYAQLEAKQAMRKACMVSQQHETRPETPTELDTQLKELRYLHREVYGALLDTEADIAYCRPNRFRRALRAVRSMFRKNGWKQNRWGNADGSPTERFLLPRDGIAELGGSGFPSHPENNGGHLFVTRVEEGCLPARICKAFFKRASESEQRRQSLFRKVLSPISSDVPSISSATRESGRKSNLFNCFGCLGTQNPSDEQKAGEGIGSNGDNHTGPGYGTVVPSTHHAGETEDEATGVQFRMMNIRNELEEDNDELGNVVCGKQAEINELEQQLLTVIEYSEKLEEKILRLEKMEKEDS